VRVFLLQCNIKARRRVTFSRGSPVRYHRAATVSTTD